MEHLTSKSDRIVQMIVDIVIVIVIIVIIICVMTRAVNTGLA